MSNKSESRICLARQPILDLNEAIIAYEMLFRQLNASDADVIDGTAATADVIMNLFNNIGLNNVIGEKKAFINFDQYLIQNDIVHILPKDRVVLEILENVIVDDDLFTLLKSLVAAGFTLAIDDFIDNESTKKLFEVVKIMKIDISDYSIDKLIEYVKLGKQYNLTLLAERVETREEFRICKDIGFELFQGYFFAKPEYIEHQVIPSNKMSIMAILNDIMTEKPIDDIQKKILQDVSLSYKLLRYINSAGLHRDIEINNIQDTIRLIGVKPLYRWLSLFLFINEDNNDSNSTTSLFTTALTRAFFLENIAIQTNKEISNDLFILGIFSFLETLLSMPFKDILKDIYIGDDIKNALLNHSGPYNDYYQLALINESPDNNKVKKILSILHLEEKNILDANLYAIQSSNNIL